MDGTSPPVVNRRGKVSVGGVRCHEATVSVRQNARGKMRGPRRFLRVDELSLQRCQ
jgi:hypothetical protein